MKQSYPNRYLRFFELTDIEKLIVFDEVDELKIVDMDGVPCLIGDDEMDYQDEHESEVDWSSRSEDEDR